MEKFRGISWMFFRPPKLARWCVEEITKLSSIDRVVLWSESGRKRGFDMSDKTLLKEFEIISQQEPDKLRNYLCKVSEWHNQGMDDFQKQYPLSFTMIWESYRKSGIIITNNLSRHLQESDAHFAFWHTYMINLITQDERDGGKLMDLDSLELVGYDPSYMFNIGRYTYKDKKGNERKTIWDIGQQEPPRFMYG